MATETKYASSVTSAGILTGTDSALGAPDGVYTTNTGNTSWTARFAIADPAGNTANGSHTVTARVRKISGQTGTPVLDSISLYDGSTLIATRTLSTNVTSATSQDVVATFTQAEVRSVSSLANLEVEIVTTAAGGSGSARTPVQLDSITWSGDFTTVVAAIDLIIQGAAQAHAADSPALTQVHELVVDSAVHGQVAGSPTIAVAAAPVDLVVQNAIQGQIASQPTLYVVPTLVVQSAVHAQGSESPTLSVTVTTALVVQSAVHGHLVGSPTIFKVPSAHIWPPGTGQIHPPISYPSVVKFHKDGVASCEARSWPEHFQLLWDGFVPEVD